LTCKYLREFSKKFEMTLVLFSGGKFAASANDAGSKAPPVSTTPTAILPPVSWTPVANYGNNITLQTP
jgi:hypothetical protein